jgi:2,5-dihydroxypyridine 5,6-dioxygenase
MLRLPTSANVSADLVHLFSAGLQASHVTAGEKLVVYSDTFSNPVYAAGFLAAARDLDAECFQVTQPLMPYDLAKGVGRAKPTPLIIEVMKGADFVVDVSTGGMLYSYEQEAILRTGTRMLRVREPEDCLLRMVPSPDVKDRALRGAQRCGKADQVRLVFDGGYELTMRRGDRAAVIQYGMADAPGRWDHWGTGLVCVPPIEESVSGTLVVSTASILFPFEIYLTEPILLHFEQGVITRIEGGREAIMLSDFIDRQGDANARRLSHVGWGVEHRARWETLAMRGWDNGGGVEARSAYANILVALGENGDLGGKNTSRLHIDIALRHGRLELDGEPIVGNCGFLAKALA